MQTAQTQPKLESTQAKGGQQEMVIRYSKAEVLIFDNIDVGNVVSPVLSGHVCHRDCFAVAGQLDIEYALDTFPYIVAAVSYITDNSRKRTIQLGWTPVTPFTKHEVESADDKVSFRLDLFMFQLRQHVSFAAKWTGHCSEKKLHSGIAV